MIEENKKFLSPEITKALEASSTAQTISFILSKDKIKVPCKIKPLHSSYYPLQESKRYESKNPYAQPIAIGLGALFHLIEISKTKKIIAVVSKIPELKAILTELNLNQYFTTSQLILCSINEVKLYFDYINYETFDLILNQHIISTLNIELQPILKTLKKNIATQITEYNTQRKFGNKWLRNSIINLLEIDSSNFTPLPIKSKAILICGAGPSLEMRAKEIKNNRHNLFVVATDSAIPFLSIFKITPDVIFSMDSNEFTKEHFIGTNNNPRIFIDYTAQKISNKNTNILFSSYPLIHFFIPIPKPLLFDSSFGNIGLSAAEYFYKIIGDEIPIITAGIDFSYYQNKAYVTPNSIDNYFKNIENYFLTSEKGQASLLYQHKLNRKQMNYATTTQLEFYASFQQNSYFTLSNSPFIKGEFINDLNIWLKDKKEKEKTIDFSIDYKIFPSICEEILTMQDEEINKLFFSFALHRRKEKIEEEIKAFIIKIMTKLKIKEK